MSKYRCDCGDTECPSCGSAQGTWSPNDIGGYGAGLCEVCNACLLDQDDCYVCDKCAAEIERIVKDHGE
jgi:hypothetical protein